MIEYETRTTQLSVAVKGDKLFSEMTTNIKIDDEAAGEFVVVEQERGQLVINPEEWQILRDAIDKMIAECREEK